MCPEYKLFISSNYANFALNNYKDIKQMQIKHQKNLSKEMKNNQLLCNENNHKYKKTELISSTDQRINESTINLQSLNIEQLKSNAFN